MYRWQPADDQPVPDNKSVPSSYQDYLDEKALSLDEKFWTVVSEGFCEKGDPTELAEFLRRMKQIADLY